MSVSLTGGAKYNIPITIPKGINDVEPNVSLVYNSQAGNGIAGFGWEINGMSSITRVAATIYHDGKIGGVNFNNMDRFALNGQRLLLKTGTGIYGGNGTEYETENYSNIKISSHGVSSFGANYGPAYFLVQYPDGSKEYYGNSSNSSSRNEWAISYWTNSLDARIVYQYLNEYNKLLISSISYGSHGTNTPINKIDFIYKTRSRPEQAYVGGQEIYINKILSEIRVKSNNIGYRNYLLEHNLNSLRYERLIKITEKTGDLSKSLNPTIFSYIDTPEDITPQVVGTNLSVNNINFKNSSNITGDFDGDGSMDMILYPTTGSDAKKKYWYFKEINNPNSINIANEHNVGDFQEIFPISWLGGGPNTGGYKLMPIQGWCIIKTNTATNTTSFTNYSDGVASYNSIYFQDLKEYQFPKFTYSYWKDPCNNGNGTSINPFIDPSDPNIPNEPVWVEIIRDIPKEFISGDFNGDGLTDVIAVEKAVSYTVTNACSSNTQTTQSGKCYFINLDRRLTANFVTNASYISITNGSKLVVADFNGDGKSDIFVFNDGIVKVYTLNENNILILLKSYTDSNIVLSRPILMGDYNVDGKADFIIPNGYGNSFTRYYSNGVQFDKYVAVYPFTYSESKIQGANSFSYHLIPYDFNSDGKTDIVEVKNLSNNDFGRISSKYYKKSGRDYFLEQGAVDTNIQTAISHYAVPVVLNYDKANPESQLSFMTKNNIFSFKCQKNNSKDVLLRSITIGNGLKESITYDSMKETPSSYENVYFKTPYTETYPNYDIVMATDIQLVSKIEKESHLTYKKQLFGYCGAVTNVEGRGFQGFRAILKTNWFNDDYPVISSITKFDLNKRGAISETYSVQGRLVYDFSTYTPSNFITKSIMNYEDLLLPNKVYKIKNTSSISYNSLEGTSKEVTYSNFDTYNNPLVTTVKSKQGSATQKTDKTTLIYDNISNATTYIIGRPKEKKMESTYGSEIFTEEELYSYNTSNLLSQIKKKGHNTNYLTEDNLYDVFGNITKKTVTAQGLEPRKTSYEYDASGRFLTKSIDIELLETVYNYDFNRGLLLNYTLPSNSGYPLITSFEYDLWGNKIKEIDYLGKKTDFAINYLDISSSGLFISSVTGEDGSFATKLYDDLGREIANGVKTINSSQPNISWKSFEYDIYDRVIKEYEPVLAVLPITANTLFSTVTYDIYGRISKTLGYTGKTTTFNYPPSTTTTTVNDGFQTVTTVKDATGATISTTDNGGTINYEYFANGNLKKTIVNGSETTIVQDGWGRKTKLTDPSAGPYDYEYNEFGEMTMERTPNGQTDFVYDDFGKVTQKTVVGLNTNSTTIYTYNPTSKLIDAINYIDNNESYSLKNEYTYDSFKRLVKTKEYRSDALYEFLNELEYDSYGRAIRERKKATTTGKFSDKWTKNTYKNGYHWQILDDATNQILWQTNEINARGQLTSANYGNGIGLNKGYDQYGFLQHSRHFNVMVNPVVDIVNLYTTFEPLRGNLIYRTNGLFNNWAESFQYDTLDRLTHYTNAQGIQVEQIYEQDGRIKENTLGKYNYNNLDIPQKKYQHTSIDINPASKAYYENRAGLFNDSMEQKAGWLIYEPSVYTYDTNVGKSGTTSLKINNTTSGEKVVSSDNWVKIDNAVPTEYTYSVYVKSDGSNPEAEIFLFMKTETETGYFTQVDQKVIATSTNWVLLEKTFLVPANIKKLNIRLDNNATGVLWFDDVCIRKTSDAIPTEREVNILYNTWKSPYEITEKGVDKISFTYNHTKSRSAMFYGGLQTDKMQRQYRKYYSADGSMEIKHNP